MCGTFLVWGCATEHVVLFCVASMFMSFFLRLQPTEMMSMSFCAQLLLALVKLTDKALWGISH